MLLIQWTKLPIFGLPITWKNVHSRLKSNIEWDFSVSPKAYRNKANSMSKSLSRLTQTPKWSSKNQKLIQRKLVVTCQSMRDSVWADLASIDSAGSDCHWPLPLIHFCFSLNSGKVKNEKKFTLATSLSQFYVFHWNIGK